MKLNGVRRFWIALAILPLLASLALASGPALFVCRGDLIARVACCCPVSEHTAAAPLSTAPSLSAGCCCDRTQVNAPTIPAVEPRESPQTVEHFVLAPLPSATALSSPASVRVWAASKLAHAPPPAIPILLSKQSFLI